MSRRLSRPGTRIAWWLATAVPVLVLVLAPMSALAQQAVPAGAASADGLWRIASDVTRTALQRRADVPGPYTVIQLDRAALDVRLARAPASTDPGRAARPVVVTLPLPDGRFSRFSIEESPILAPEIGAAFPEIKTYRGSGLDDRTATARLDVTPAGVHGFIIAAGGTIYVDPFAPGDRVNHVSFSKADLQPSDRPFRDLLEDAAELPRPYNDMPITNGAWLKTYRLALAATKEYVDDAGGTREAALARMTTSMNRINGIFERELAVHLTVLTGTSDDPLALISTDPRAYTNGSGSTMLTQNQSRLDGIIHTENYDIGHVFSTGAGGVASLSSVCSALSKGRGVTGLPHPVGNGFDVDFVAHELGHQFGANHTFNGTTSNCGGNRSASHAYEVGSGSTIMAYAGTCGGENLQGHSDDFFNFESLNEITAFITSAGGSTCGVTTATGNTPPTVAVAGTSFRIPGRTPFALSAAAADADNDSLTFIWEQHDLGAASTDVTSASTDAGNRPLFRSPAPTADPLRYFPSLSYVLSAANSPPRTRLCPIGMCLTGEVLPSTARTMSFELTVRDNHPNGGGIATAATQVIVDASVGPFAVDSPATSVTWPAGSLQTITWSANGTEALAGAVRILLSTDGGRTFPTTLLASTPNNGAAIVVVPVVQTMSARIKIEAVGNIFFDISNADITVAVAPVSGDIAIDFGPAYGLWERYNPTGTTPLWMPIHPYSPSVMAAGDIDGNGQSDLVVDFPGYGVWTWMNNASWVAVNLLDATRIVVADLDGNGRDDIVLNFPGYGVWVCRDDRSWTQLHNLEASLLAAGNLDGDAGRRADVIADFPGFGVWTYVNNAGWVQLHSLDAAGLAAGDVDGNGQDELFVSFPGNGLWMRANDGRWSPLNSLNPAGMTVGNIDGDAAGRQDVVINFPGYGVWAFINGDHWVQLHGLNAATMAVRDLDGDGKGDVILSFPGFGVWLLMDNASYVQLHPFDPELTAAGQFDGR